ncbi:hypothetical protein F5Y02DRAFT_423932 [Annulohypoxylon stygium]|nr:hypothetical protein F5Y02DRAFT_423932 [Annulohypoxylon stygium]
MCHPSISNPSLFHRSIIWMISIAIWAGGGAYGAPSAPSAHSLWTIRTNEPLNIWATFWDATDHSVNIEFKTDGDWKDVCDVRAFHTVSVQQQPLGYTCEWLTVDEAVWTLTTGDWKRFGPPSQLAKGRCMEAGTK